MDLLFSEIFIVNKRSKEMESWRDALGKESGSNERWHLLYYQDLPIKVPTYLTFKRYPELIKGFRISKTRRRFVFDE